MINNTDILVKYPNLDDVRDFQKGALLKEDAFLHRLCPLCNRTDYQEIGQVDIFPIVQCNNCTMIYNRYFPNEGYSLSTDTSVKDYYQVADITFDVENIKKLKKHLTRVFIENMADSSKETFNYMDFGCGTGIYVRAAKELGWNAYGVDHNDNQRKAAKDVYEVDIQRSLEDIDSRISFDFVTMNYVASTLNRPMELIKTIFDRINDGGMMLITDHNIGSYSVKRDGIIHYYYTPPRVNHFTKESLSKFLLQCGFKEVVKVKEARLDLNIFFLRATHKCEYYYKESMKQMPVKRYNSRAFKFFRRIFSLIRETLKRCGCGFIENMGYGDEVQVLVRK